MEPPETPTFQIRDRTEPSETVIAGFSAFGLAGLTAVDFLVKQLELEETGHVTATSVPTITPFEDGRPRHHSRFFSRDDLDVTVLVNELVVPTWAADSFAEAVLSWSDANGVEEMTVLSGIPVAHGPDEHDVFHVATDDYREERLGDADIRGMGNGFLDGVNASLVARGMDSALRTGVLITPVHAQVPDVAAAIRLVEAVEGIYDLSVDAGPLEAFAAEVESYYQGLQDRLDTVEDRYSPDDRMYM